MTTENPKMATNTNEITMAEQPIYPPIVDFPSDSYFLKYEEIIRQFIPARTNMANLASKLRTFEEDSEGYKHYHTLACQEHKKCEELSARAGIPMGQMPTIDM
ncbi:hypothetical protein CDAR_444681 [Caerostris darwini]|uniref:Uncharacterized protein n=1 Tax=Caerostris darwini TaxID=1538125 RepID=A0AAV4W886_9ARAC|nr:hypothetical protein CDAR_444681 [Caerostris darwini]